MVEVRVSVVDASVNDMLETRVEVEDVSVKGLLEVRVEVAHSSQDSHEAHSHFSDHSFVCEKQNGLQSAKRRSWPRRATDVPLLAVASRPVSSPIRHARMRIMCKTSTDEPGMSKLS